ncbi:hypothetical protein CSB11_02060 [Candidatus Campbellbacteria bacterium]|nr:MAG: hypothetical protein CSB11_02060 [Candidatus Campbellbacteria bacterium]
MVYISKKRRKYLIEKKIKKFFFKFLVPIISLFILTIFLHNAQFMKIKNFNIVGNKYVSKEDIQNQFDTILQEKYFGIYNKNNFIFYPESQMEKVLLENQKRIKNIDISYQNLRKIKIEIEEKDPKYLFCFEKEKCNFTEYNGKIFTPFNQEKTEIKRGDFVVFQDLFLGYVNQDETEVLRDFQNYNQVYTPSLFEKVTTLLKAFENYNLSIKKVIRNKDGNFVLYTKSNKKILIKYNQDFEKIIPTLKTLSQKKIFRVDKFEKDFNSDLIYVDLTYQDYIFYCQKGEVCQNNYVY